VKHTPVAEKPDAHARAFRLGNSRAKIRKKRLNVRPTYIPADRTLKKQMQRFPVFGLHGEIISLDDVMSRQQFDISGFHAHNIIQYLL
jgi:hypothetical protein